MGSQKRDAAVFDALPSKPRGCPRNSRPVIGLIFKSPLPFALEEFEVEIRGKWDNVKERIAGQIGVGCWQASTPCWRNKPVFPVFGLSPRAHALADPENLRALPASSLFHPPRHSPRNTSAGPIKKPRRIRRGQETVLSAYRSEGGVCLGVLRHHGLLPLAPPPHPTAAAGCSDGTQQQGAGLGDSG